MNAVVERAPAMQPEQIPAQTAGQSLTPLEMLDRAVAGGATPDTLEKLMGLQERWETTQARKAFDNAMAEAKARIPVIMKNKTVSHGVGKTSFKHEDMAQIARTIDPILSSFGLSYRFRTSSEGGRVSVTCVVSHRDGHSETNELSGPPETSGSKNSIQAIGSSVTFLQRYTLKAALGLAASDDDDGKSAGSGAAISEEQLGELQSLIAEVAADIQKFCRYMKVETLADIPATKFADAKAALEAKRQAA
jgi:hypothetical protein